MNISGNYMRSDNYSDGSYHTPVLMSQHKGMYSGISYNTGTTANHLPFSLNSLGGTGGANNFY